LARGDAEGNPPGSCFFNTVEEQTSLGLWFFCEEFLE
jgi:hypothetical protein